MASVEVILVLVCAAGLTVLIFTVLLSVRQKIRLNRLNPRGPIDAQARYLMPKDAVDHRLETSMKTRVLLRRYFRDKDFDYNMAESDLNYLSRRCDSLEGSITTLIIFDLLTGCLWKRDNKCDLDYAGVAAPKIARRE
eukprot:gene10184-2343_t